MADNESLPFREYITLNSPVAGFLTRGVFDSLNREDTVAMGLIQTPEFKQYQAANTNLQQAIISSAMNNPDPEKAQKELGEKVQALGKIYADGAQATKARDFIKDNMGADAANKFDALEKAKEAFGKKFQEKTGTSFDSVPKEGQVAPTEAQAAATKIKGYMVAASSDEIHSKARQESIKPEFAKQLAELKNSPEFKEYRSALEKEGRALAQNSQNSPIGEEAIKAFEERSSQGELKNAEKKLETKIDGMAQGERKEAVKDAFGMMLKQSAMREVLNDMESGKLEAPKPEKTMVPAEKAPDKAPEKPAEKSGGPSLGDKLKSLSVPNLKEGAEALAVAGAAASLKDKITNPLKTAEDVMKNPAGTLNKMTQDGLTVGSGMGNKMVQDKAMDATKGALGNVPGGKEAIKGLENIAEVLKKNGVDKAVADAAKFLKDSGVTNALSAPIAVVSGLAEVAKNAVAPSGGKGGRE